MPAKEKQNRLNRCDQTIRTPHVLTSASRHKAPSRASSLCEHIPRTRSESRSTGKARSADCRFESYLAHQRNFPTSCQATPARRQRGYSPLQKQRRRGPPKLGEGSCPQSAKRISECFLPILAAYSWSFESRVARNHSHFEDFISNHSP